MSCSIGAGRRRRRLCAVALTLALVTALPAQSFADGLAAACRSLLQRYVFNCDCTSAFLEETLSAEHAEIVLKLWILAINGPSQNDQLVNLYIQHGRKTVDDAVMSFHRHRGELRSYCSHGDGPLIAD